MQESKQKVTKVVSLVKMMENLPSVSRPHNCPYTESIYSVIDSLAGEQDVSKTQDG